MSAARIIEGDCLDVLATLPEQSVQTCITSPPYFGLRAYGGGDAEIGAEETPEQYVANLVAVFREVRRVLRDDGTLWLNLGDSYCSTDKWGGGVSGNTGKHTTNGADVPSWAVRQRSQPIPGVKPKDLIGVPWMVAFALRADGWYLRSDIIWNKPNPMPESVTDRPTKAHEYLFLLSKSARYFYDADAVREDGSGLSGGGFSRATAEAQLNHGAMRLERPDVAGRNKRSVWTVATQPFPGAHFATFPPKLIEPCVLAGSRAIGSVIEPEYVESPLAERVGDDPSLLTGRAGMNRPRHPDEGTRRITVAEQRNYAAQLRESPHRAAMEAESGSAFAHYLRTDASGARPIPAALLGAWIERGWLARAAVPAPIIAEPSQCTVLDPFSGAGTTGVVALRHDRDFIGVELNPSYAQMARHRIQDDAPLLNEVA